jgi:hypothetical protein
MSRETLNGGIIPSRTGFQERHGKVEWRTRCRQKNAADAWRLSVPSTRSLKWLFAGLFTAWDTGIACIAAIFLGSLIWSSARGVPSSSFMVAFGTDTLVVHWLGCRNQGWTFGQQSWKAIASETPARLQH